MVIRPNAADAGYRPAASQLPAPVDLSDERHRTLIAAQQALTAAHPLLGGAPKQISINGKLRAVAERAIYPDFKMLLTDRLSGDAAPLMAQLAAMPDIALIKLASLIDKVCRDGDAGA